jgi:hypothetical protein
MTFRCRWAFHREEKYLLDLPQSVLHLLHFSYLIINTSTSNNFKLLAYAVRVLVPFFCHLIGCVVDVLNT